jgi:hypothetical protein
MGERSPIEIRHVEKLSHDQPALTEAYRQSFHLIEKGLMTWHAACWDGKAVIAYADGRPVGMINYSVSEDTLIASIDFAFSLPERPEALTQCLLVLRRLLRLDSRVREMRFTYHAGNEAMHKAGHLLRAQLHSSTYRAFIR